jgi:hypothetical protein
VTTEKGQLRGNDVAEDKDDDVVRTSVSQGQVTVTLCNDELFLSTQFIWFSPHIKQVKCGGRGRKRTVNMKHLAVPAGFHISWLDLQMFCKVSDKIRFSVQLFCEWGRQESRFSYFRKYKKDMHIIRIQKHQDNCTF